VRGGGVSELLHHLLDLPLISVMMDGWMDGVVFVTNYGNWSS
jgi:hypothetical protein